MRDAGRPPRPPAPGGRARPAGDAGAPRPPQTRRTPRPATGGPRPAGGPPPRNVPVVPADGRIRVSKILADQGLCSRREADVYIERGWVLVDGVPVTELGTRALPTQRVTLSPAARSQQRSLVTILVHKPIGYVSGQAEDGYEPAVVLVRPEHQFRPGGEGPRFEPANLRGLAPAGRLDIDSTGLLVLTQDGRIARQLIGEDSGIEKEYLVRVTGTIRPGGLQLLRHGLALDGKALKRADVRWQNDDQLRFVLKEGRKRQIRRMCELVDLEVTGLKRVRIGTVRLGDLPVGQWRFLASGERFG